ncbi:hypothetical protein [Streptomyces sp. NPDC051567]|uniref:hypothetical protein n=1 Tax=Streptomyces sp. NPDC051567 TaxID=3365660 RepID=UPI0037AEF5F6
MDPHTGARTAPPPAPVPPPRTLAEPPGPTAHTVTTTDRGAFCLAVCSCGWTGPARRSRDLARRDAARHTAP